MEKIIDLLARISTLYAIPQWIVNVGAIAIFIILVAFPFVVRHLMQPKYYRFRELILFKVLWRWKYKKGEVIGLWCYCPKCQAMLMVDDENCRSTESLQNKITFFVCNECGGNECGRVVGGDRRYALSLVKREIWRHINAGTFAEVSKATKEALELYPQLEMTSEPHKHEVLSNDNVGEIPLHVSESSHEITQESDGVSDEIENSLEENSVSESTTEEVKKDGI